MDYLNSSNLKLLVVVNAAGTISRGARAGLSPVEEADGRGAGAPQPRKYVLPERDSSGTLLFTSSRSTPAGDQLLPGE